MRHWLRNLMVVWRQHQDRRPHLPVIRERFSFRPTLEGLEDRCLLSGNFLQGSLVADTSATMPALASQMVHSSNVSANSYDPGRRSIAENDKDFLSTYTGPQNPDMTPVSAKVTLNNATQQLQFSAVLAGNIGTTPGSGALNSATPLYVFGLNRGAGTQRFLSGSPSIGAGVYFDSVIVLNPNGPSKFIDFINPANTQVLPATDIHFDGNHLTASFPLSDFPSTGVAPVQYTWNFWPRYGLGANNQVADFLPDANDGGTGGYNAPVQVVHGQNENNGPPAGHHAVYDNLLDSYDTTIPDDFNTAINNIGVNQFFLANQVPTSQLQQAFTTLAGLAPQQNLQELTQLVGAEVELAIDTLLDLTGELGGIGKPPTGLVSDMHALQQSIQQNPLEGTPAGALTGAMSFDLSLGFALSSASGGQSNDGGTGG